MRVWVYRYNRVKHIAKAFLCMGTPFNTLAGKNPNNNAKG